MWSWGSQPQPARAADDENEEPQTEASRFKTFLGILRK